MVTVTLSVAVTIPETTQINSEEEAIDEAYEIIHCAPAFDQIDAEELAHHTDAIDVVGIDSGQDETSAESERQE